MSASARASVLSAAVSARARLRIATGERVEGCRLELLQHVNPLEACARHKVLAVQHALDELAGFEQAALVQLESNRGALFAMARDDETDIQAIFDAKVSEVARLSTTRRVALERELVNADSALEEAIGATNAAIDVRASMCDPSPLVRHDTSVMCRPVRVSKTPMLLRARLLSFRVWIVRVAP